MKANFIRARIALTVGSNGQWSATGFSGMTTDESTVASQLNDESVLEDSSGVVTRRYWVEVEVPVPQEETLKGEIAE